MWRVVVPALLMLVAAATSPSEPALAAEGYSVGSGTTQQIAEHGVCRKVTNAIGGGLGLYVPTKFSPEWSVGSNAFINNVITGVTLAACLDAASLRFKGNAYLTRLPATGNSQIFTWSGWIKRGGGFGTAQDLFSAYYSTAYFTIFSIDAGDKLQYYNLVASAGRAWVASKGVLRDPNAWYHIVLSVNATTGWGRVYINGVDQTDTLNPVANVASSINNPSTNHFIGVRGNGTGYFNGYMSDVYFVDGQALTASDFGETDPDTGQWIPKQYAGTYGTNGFHLTFANPASLGNDSSGGAKHWTPTNFGTTPGTTYDPMGDYASGSFGGSYSTLNQLHGYNATVSAGNLTAVLGAAGWSPGTQAFDAATDNVYFEAVATAWTGQNFAEFGIIPATYPTGGTGYWSGPNVGYLRDGQKRVNNSASAFGASYTLNDVIGVHVNAGTVTFYKNGVSQGAATTGLTGYWFPALFLPSSASTLTASINFGQRSFSHTPPAGARALNTYSMPAPAIVTPTAYFKTITYTGNGSYQSIGTPPKLSGGANISSSLRFRSAGSTYLNRTPAGTGTDLKTFTIGLWFKRGIPSTGVAQVLASTNTNGFSAQLADSAGGVADTLRIYNYNGGYTYHYVSAQHFRDPSAWYHLVISVDTTDAVAADRVKIYINGVRITSWTTQTNPSLNATSAWNDNVLSYVGRFVSPGNYFYDGYIADFYNVDGQALPPTAFGQFNSAGLWVPKAYTGTYGTNGFHLEFKNKSNTTAATLGADTSNNGNNWTPNNFSVAAGAADDVLRDAPADYSDGNGDHANFATMNPLDKHANVTVSDGNLVMSTGAQANAISGRATTFVTSGKWYWEAHVAMAGTDNTAMIGVGNRAANLASYPGVDANAWSYFAYDGTKYNAAVGSAYGGTYANGTIIGTALDMDAGKVWFSKNGVWQASGDPAAGTGAAFSGLVGPLTAIAGDGGTAGTATFTFNFGQRPFAYTPPTGFKGLNTYNISNTDFVPDLVWIKGRSGATDHAIYDTARGATLDLATNSTAAETAQSTGLLGFNAGGFSVGSLAKLNTSGATYVAWMFKKGVTPGFNVVTWTGDGTNARQIAHSLGVAPAMIIHKAAGDGTYAWNSWHKGLNADYYNQLNTTVGQDNSVNIWPTAGITSSYFTTTSAAVKYNNMSGVRHVAYVFAEVPGFSKFGSYAGNGSADGPFVSTGFKPAFVLIKRSDSTENWIMKDGMRLGYNPANYTVYPNLTAAEGNDSQLDLVANGFKLRNTSAGGNVNGATYIYAAFAEQPFKYATAR